MQASTTTVLLVRQTSEFVKKDEDLDECLEDILSDGAVKQINIAQAPQGHYSFVSGVLLKENAKGLGRSGIEVDKMEHCPLAFQVVYQDEENVYEMIGIDCDKETLELNKLASSMTNYNRMFFGSVVIAKYLIKQTRPNVQLVPRNASMSDVRFLHEQKYRPTAFFLAANGESRRYSFAYSPTELLVDGALLVSDHKKFERVTRKVHAAHIDVEIIKLINGGEAGKEAASEAGEAGKEAGGADKEAASEAGGANEVNEAGGEANLEVNKIATMLNDGDLVYGGAIVFFKTIGDNGAEQIVSVSEELFQKLIWALENKRSLAENLKEPFNENIALKISMAADAS